VEVTTIKGETTDKTPS